MLLYFSDMQMNGNRYRVTLADCLQSNRSKAGGRKYAYKNELQ